MLRNKKFHDDETFFSSAWNFFLIAMGHPGEVMLFYAKTASNV